MATSAPIDYNALAAQNGAISSNPPPVSSAPTPPRPNGGSVDYNALAAQSGAISSSTPSTPAPTAPPTQQSEGFWSKVKNGIKQSALGQAAQTAFAPPENAMEASAHGTGGDIGLVAYRMANKLVGLHSQMMKSTGDMYIKAKDEFQNAAIDYMLSSDKDPILSGAKHDAMMHALSGAADLVGAANPEVAGVTSEASDITEGSTAGKDLVTPLTRGLVDVGTAAAGAAAPGAVADVAEGAEAPEAAAETTAAAPTPAQPNIVQQVLKGDKASQAPAQSALRSTAQATADDAGVTTAATPGQGIRTLMDEPIEAIAKTERATYDAVNKAAGTDMKSLYDHAEEVQDALDDPTNIANRKSLTEDLQTTQEAIKDGETKATAAGVDPETIKDAQAMTQKRYAIQNVKQKLFNNESVVSGNAAHGAPESINVDSAIRQVETLNKPSKFAPEGTPTRLQQALGEKGAQNLLQQLYDAQKAGKTALSKQQLVIKLAKYGGPALATGAGTIYEMTK